MKIPMELILERMAYLNPRVCLSDRGIWVSGVRMLPSKAEKISNEYIYFCKYEDLSRTNQDLIFVAAAPGDAPLPQDKRCILLEPSAPVVIRAMHGQSWHLQQLLRNFRSTLRSAGLEDGQTFFLQLRQLRLIRIHGHRFVLLMYIYI